jgi:hypothetical protein
MLRVTVVAALATAAVVVLGPGAAAAGSCKSNVAAFCQYTEEAPTSTGAQPVGNGGDKQVAKLPRSAQRSIEKRGQAEATALKRIATTAGAAAPAKVKISKAERKRVQRALKTVKVEQAKPVRAGLGAVSSDGNGRLVVLAIVMGLTTAAAVALAVMRRRSSSRP